MVYPHRDRSKGLSVDRRNDQSGRVKKKVTSTQYEIEGCYTCNNQRDIMTGTNEKKQKIEKLLSEGKISEALELVDTRDECEKP